MEYRSLGRTGVKISPLILGSFNFGGATSEKISIRIIHKALDVGINMIDTANYYNEGESEHIIGKALSDHNRGKVILATKVHFPVSNDINDRGNSRRHIMQALDDSLKRLGTDWIDLYQIHRPDFEIPQDETLQALDNMVRHGKVRYIGCSTFPAWMIMEALALSEKYNLSRYVTEQPPYNLLDRRIENELVPLAQRYQIGLIPWSPLAMGMLAGRYPISDKYPGDSRAAIFEGVYADRVTEKAVKKGNEITSIAQKNMLSPSQLALLWVKDQPGITAPIIGPRTLDHLDDALPVLDMKLDEETNNALNDIFPPGSAIADFHNSSGWMKMQV